MIYTFQKGQIQFNQYKNLDARNITVQVHSGEKERPKVRNDYLNGKHKIYGVLDSDCLPHQSKFNAGNLVRLKLFNEQNKTAVLHILILKFMGVVTPSPHIRRYTWSFCAIQKAAEDNIGIFPGTYEGEMSLEDLLSDLGSSMEEMHGIARKFTAEGGFL